MYSFFFLNDTATPELYTLPLPDALPFFPARDPVLSVPATRACRKPSRQGRWTKRNRQRPSSARDVAHRVPVRSEEHTSELQSRQYLVCRLLLEKKTKDDT